MILTAEEPRAVPCNNSRKSCGPKTPEGKARSSGNAIKQELRAEAFALPIKEACGLAERTDDRLDDDLPETPDRRARLDYAVLATLQQRRCARFGTADTAQQIRAPCERFDGEPEEEVARLKELFFEDPATAVRAPRRAAGCRWLLSPWLALALIFEAGGCCQAAAGRDLATWFLGLQPDLVRSDADVSRLRRTTLTALPGDCAQAWDGRLDPSGLCGSRSRSRAEVEDRVLGLGGAEGALWLWSERRHEATFHRASQEWLKGEGSEPKGVAALDAPPAVASVLVPVPSMLREDDVPWDGSLLPDGPLLPRVVPPAVESATRTAPNEANGLAAHTDPQEVATAAAPTEANGLAASENTSEAAPTEPNGLAARAAALEAATAEAPAEPNEDRGIRSEPAPPHFVGARPSRRQTKRLGTGGFGPSRQGPHSTLQTK